MTDWRLKNDEDLTREDLLEMERLGTPVDDDGEETPGLLFDSRAMSVAGRFADNHAMTSDEAQVNTRDIDVLRVSA